MTPPDVICICGKHISLLDLWNSGWWQAAILPPRQQDKWLRACSKKCLEKTINNTLVAL